MESISIENLDELQIWVANFSKKLRFKDIILLSGPMGVGKSQFTQFLVAGLSPDTSCSPTYAIHNAYSSTQGSIDHVDLYRVEDEDDLESTGFWDLFDQEKAIVCIEWADRMPLHIYPRGWTIHHIQLEPVSESQRSLTYARLND